MTRRQNHNQCAFCEQDSRGYELCAECYHLSKKEYIIKNDKGKFTI